MGSFCNGDGCSHNVGGSRESVRHTRRGGRGPRGRPHHIDRVLGFRQVVSLRTGTQSQCQPAGLRREQLHRDDRLHQRCQARAEGQHRNRRPRALPPGAPRGARRRVRGRRRLLDHRGPRRPGNRLARDQHSGAQKRRGTRHGNLGHPAGLPQGGRGEPCHLHAHEPMAAPK